MDTLLSADSTINFMDHHAVAAVSLTGISLDVLGGLYLAYDLLGGQHGPLRLLTRMVTYSIVFGLGYGLDLGLFFAATAGYYAGQPARAAAGRVRSRSRILRLCSAVISISVIDP